MPHHVQQHQAQPFEQIMATIFTCRSLLKYNLALNEEQKSALLADIDTSLQILQTHLISSTSVDARITSVHLSQANNDVAISHEDKTTLSQEREQNTLQALYRMYHY